jgi:Glycosyl hydrolase family 46
LGTHLTNKYAEKQQQQDYARRQHEKEIEEQRTRESQDLEHRRRESLAALENQRHAHEKELEDKRSRDLKASELRQAQFQRELDFRRAQANVVEGRKIEHARVLEPYLKYIDSEKPSERQFGYQMFASLGYEKLAADIISLRADLAGKDVLKNIQTASSDEGARQVAATGLRALKEEELRRIESIINIFETGKDSYAIFVPELLERFGVNASPHVPLVLNAYGHRPDAQHKAALGPYLSRLGRREEAAKVYADPQFIELARQIKADPVMLEVEKAYQRDHFFAPAVKEAEGAGLKTVLSLAVVYDTIMNMGVNGFRRLKEQASQQLGGTPAAGADEKQWVKAFLVRRRENVASRPGMRVLVSRVNAYIDLAEAGNWDLTPPFKIKGMNVD